MIRFARDENGEIKRKQPCQTEGCDWPNYHVCLVGKPNRFYEALKKRQIKGKRVMSERTPEHREALAQAMRDRWERYRELNKHRNERIVARYKEGNIGVKGLQEEFGVGYRVISNVLHEAAANGEIVIRPRGKNLRQQRETVGAYN